MKDIFIPFAIGVTIFLFGLQLMRIGLEKLVGSQLEKWLLGLTNTPFRGFLTGIFSTALLQSSSAVTVLTISFVDLGILTFTRSVGIILGSNIGTTITTEIMALNIEDFALPLIFVGICLYLLPSEKISMLALILVGFGCLFLGMETMKWLVNPLKDRGTLDWFIGLSGNSIVTGIGIGCLLTAILHSSSATTMITMGFYASGLLPLSFSIAIVLGSNVGTCITAIMATFRTSTAAKQVAAAHLVLNVVGVLLFAPLIPLISDWSSFLSNQPAQQLAHIQTIFNIICSLMVLPFVASFSKFIIWCIPHRENHAKTLM